MLQVDGRHVGILCTPGTVAGGKVLGDPTLKMDGPAVFKLAVGIQQIYVRYARGQTKDARFASFEDRVVGLAEAALEVAERSRL